MAAVESSPSLWWPLPPPWLSPGAAWFVLFTVMVGAVAVMSRAEQAPPPPPSSSTRRRLTRSASSMVLERLRSFSAAFSFVHSISGVQEDDIPSETMSTDAAAAASGCEEAEEENPISLDEAHPHPVVAAVCPPPQAAAAATAGEVAAATAEERPRKRREAAKVVAVKGRAFAEVEGKAEVNARAERFIRRFREDLKLQRIMSALNRSHALTGGAAASSSAP
uniref:DUF4408 domain-containing protein n=1 Tax=Oryza punctata TaxID=4537 RepID=A0A0E0LUQ1_ORYPU